MLLVLLVIICIFCYTITSSPEMNATGGSIRTSAALVRAYELFMRLQDINTHVIQAKTERDFWIVNFALSMANLQFAQGINVQDDRFPLVANPDIITHALKDMKIWDDIKIKDKVLETIQIINTVYPTDNIMKRISDRVTITEYAMNLMKRKYPNVSDENIIAYLLRYGGMYTYIDNKDIKISKVLLSIPPKLYHYYNSALPNIIESFASPINHTLDKYCSIYEDDKDFGAVGPFTDKFVRDSPIATFIVNPPYDAISMDYVSRIIENNASKHNFVICLPAKDGGLFHLHNHRLYHKKDEGRHMDQSLFKLLSINTLTGILIVPAKIMFYWSFFKQKKQKIDYDTIMIYYINNRDTMKIISDVKKILEHGLKNTYPIQEDKIKKMFPNNALTIIKSLSIT